MRQARYASTLVALACGLVALTIVPGALGVVDQGVAKNRDLQAASAPLAPSAAQLAAVRALDAHATWNAFGTPASLIAYGGYLQTGLSGDAAVAARDFIAQHASLFKLTDASNASLELVADNKLKGSAADAHAVLFRQRFGDLGTTQNGLITVGVVSGKIAYVSSSSAGTLPAPAAATLTAAEAWAKAAAAVGLDGGALSVVGTTGDWTLLQASALAQQQRVKLVAYPTAGGVRAAYEATVENVKGATSVAYIVYVDARSGEILFRQNAVYNDATPTTTTFKGAMPNGTTCGTYHDFTVGAGNASIEVVASAALATNDIVLTLEQPRGNVLGSSDTATSPEAVHYTPAGGVAPGTYSVRVCPFGPSPTVPFTQPGDYAGTFTTNPASTPATPPVPTPPAAPSPFSPTWKYFPNSPSLDYASTDVRSLACWVLATGCDLVVGNPSSPLPWDVDPNTGAPSSTTRGNNANSAEAWASPLTPAEHYQPVSATRSYQFPWTNQWHDSSCSPASFASPQRVDIDAAVTNLFVLHNRMHDFSYKLGFTETAWNLQQSNFGKTDGSREHDPELGDAQAGAVDGGNPSFEGRDNANQIALQDGVPGITNMYLWQPIAGAFYGPCVDGDYDMSVVGHEYTHAISNRMVGGPDANLTGLQAGAMGESWSDLDALEFMHSTGLVPFQDGNPWSVGAYVTGNKDRGIRDYALDANPLNFSDVGFDVTGPEVHADGEIWNGVNYTVRQALVDKWNSQFPASDAQLQLDCANGLKTADQCPGNRRWIQIVYDAFLLMQPSVSMVDARDAYLAADRLVFDGANQTALWNGFAHGGLGVGAASAGSDDTDPTPSFESPAEPSANVTFSTVDENGAPVTATIYAGDYQARVTPVPTNAKFVPGAYSFVAQAPGYGLVRFSETLAAGDSTVTVTMPTNWASAAKGATASGDGVNQAKLIDDSEATDWAALGQPVAGRSVTVHLGGGAHVVDRVRVSALVHPADANDPSDSGSQSRFSALRAFEIWTCDASSGADCSQAGSYTKAYTSAADAFPAGLPRPAAPDLNVRSFDIGAVQATDVKLVVVSNQCTGAPAYAGEQDADPTNPTDCSSGSDQAKNVRAAELEVLAAG